MDHLALLRNMLGILNGFDKEVAPQHTLDTQFVERCSQTELTELLIDSPEIQTQLFTRLRSFNSITRAKILNSILDSYPQEKPAENKIARVILSTHLLEPVEGNALLVKIVNSDYTNSTILAMAAGEIHFLGEKNRQSFHTLILGHRYLDIATLTALQIRDSEETKYSLFKTLLEFEYIQPEALIGMVERLDKLSQSTSLKEGLPRHLLDDIVNRILDHSQTTIDVLLALEKCRSFRTDDIRKRIIEIALTSHNMRPETLDALAEALWRMPKDQQFPVALKILERRPLTAHTFIWLSSSDDLAQSIKDNPEILKRLDLRLQRFLTSSPMSEISVPGVKVNFPKTGSITIVTSKTKARRKIPTPAGKAWIQLSQIEHIWDGTEFKVPPIEPILDMLNYNSQVVELETEILAGRNFDDFNAANNFRKELGLEHFSSQMVEEIKAQIDAIINRLDEINFDHGHLKLANFVIVPQKDLSGNIRFKGLPSAYLIDFDQATFTQPVLPVRPNGGLKKSTDALVAQTLT